MNALDYVFDQKVKQNFKESEFVHKLLQEDERPSKQDLEYWIDKTYLFGVEDEMPLYDGMSYIKYRNWDVYALYLAIIFLFLYLFKTVFGLLFGQSNKVKSA